MKSRFLVPGALALVLAATACSGSGTSASPSSAPTAAPSSAAADHNGADVMFAQMMIPHHAQAVEMSDILLAKPGVRDDLAELARQIKGAQQPEIDQMNSWLKQWNAPTGGNHSGHMGMDGMLGPEELDALRRADTAAAQKQFVEGMIAHHEGAVAMAEQAQKNGRSAEVKKMCDEIIRTQRAEIATMKGMLPTL